MQKVITIFHSYEADTINIGTHTARTYSQLDELLKEGYVVKQLHASAYNDREALTFILEKPSPKKEWTGSKGIE